MTNLTRTLREILTLTHCANAHLCVRYNEWNVARAKQSLADALDARDRLRAAERIDSHIEAPAIPPWLFRK
jgi:hypothetical protein